MTTELFCPDETRRDEFRAASGPLPHAMFSPSDQPWLRA